MNSESGYKPEYQALPRAEKKGGPRESVGNEKMLSGDRRVGKLDEVVTVLVESGVDPGLAREIRAEVDERGFGWLERELSARIRAVDDEDAAQRIADGLS